MVVAIFYVLRDNYRIPFLFEKDEHLDSTGVIRLALAEEVTFLNKANIQRALNQIPEGSKVVIDASKTVNIDVDVIEIIDDFKINAATKNIDVEVLNRRRKGIKTHPIKDFEKVINEIPAPVLN